MFRLCAWPWCPKYEDHILENSEIFCIMMMNISVKGMILWWSHVHETETIIYWRRLFLLPGSSHIIRIVMSVMMSVMLMMVMMTLTMMMVMILGIWYSCFVWLWVGLLPKTSFELLFWNSNMIFMMILMIMIIIMIDSVLCRCSIYICL